MWSGIIYQGNEAVSKECKILSGCSYCFHETATIEVVTEQKHAILVIKSLITPYIDNTMTKLTAQYFDNSIALVWYSMAVDQIK